MKVNTDGISLGGWVNLNNARNILDIGTGSGLIALMLAQRSANDDSKILAVDIDEGAVQQANINVKQSPWQSKIRVEHQDITSWQTSKKFDLIVSNPPYFTNNLSSPDKQRQLARHNSGLPFELLTQQAANWLTDGGEFSVIIPKSEYDHFSAVAKLNGLFELRHCKVKTTPSKPASRCLLTYSKSQKQVTHQEQLTIRDGNNEYTPDYKKLLKDFYLKM